MAKWIITWNVGYGDESGIIEAETEEKAREAAYEAAREAFENSATWNAEPYSKEAAIDAGLEDEEAEDE